VTLLHHVRYQAAKHERYVPSDHEDPDRHQKIVDRWNGWRDALEAVVHPELNIPGVPITIVREGKDFDRVMERVEREYHGTDELKAMRFAVSGLYNSWYIAGLGEDRWTERCGLRSKQFPRDHTFVGAIRNAVRYRGIGAGRIKRLKTIALLFEGVSQ
jgi:hypothetical protein